MKRNYDDKTLKALREEERIESIYGTEVVVRKVPFENRKGILDPRLKAAYDAKKDINGVIAPPFDPAKLELPADEILLILQQLTDAGAKKREEEAMAARPDGSADDLTDVDIECKWGEIDSDGRKAGFYRYKPTGRAERKRPCFISIHGGGWALGHPMRNDPFCRYLADKVDAIVFDVDYALAPQHRFPAGLNDCWNILKYVYDNADSLGIDKTKIVVGGGSAGGNLTAALALKDRDNKTGMIALHVPMVPCMILRDYKVEGYNVSADDYDFAEETIAYTGKPEVPERTMEIAKMVDGYVGIDGGKDPYASPLLAEDFTGLPKAIVQVSGLDNLWPHGVHYGKFMRNGGCDVKIIMYEGMDHGSVGSVGLMPQAEDMLLEIIDAMAKL